MDSAGDRGFGPTAATGLAVPPVAARAYAILALLFAFQTINFFDKLAFGISGVSIMQEFSFTPKQFGLLGAAFFIVFAIGGIATGLIFVGRYSNKSILLVLAAIWTISQFPVAFTHSITVIVLCRLLLGLGEGAGISIAMAVAYEWFPPQRRSLATAVILQGICAGFLIGGPLLTFFVVHYGWRSSFLVCGIFSLVWMAVWWIVGREGPFSGRLEDPGPQSRLPIRVLWFDRTVIGVLLVNFATYWVVGMAAVWLPPYLRLGLGYGAVDAGWIISAIYVVQSPLLLLGSALAQTMRRRGWSARISLGWSSGFALLLSGLALILAVRGEPGAPQTMLLALGFSMPSLTTIYCPVILADVVPPVQRARLLVVIISVGVMGAVCSTYGNGWIVSSFPGDPRTGYAVAFGLGGAVLLLGALIGFGLLFPERTLARFDRIRATVNAD